MEVYCRSLMRGDTPELLALFVRIRASIARLSTMGVYKAIIKEGLEAKNIICLVAVLNDKLVGYVIAVRNWYCFKLMFPLKHPTVGLSIVGTRLKALLKTQHNKVLPLNTKRLPSSPVTHMVGEHSWEDNAPTLAKIIHIGVDETARSKGIGSALYAFLVEYLAQEGFRKISALIDEGNLASVRLHERNGWTVVRRADGFFAFIEISVSDERDE